MVRTKQTWNPWTAQRDVWCYPKDEKEVCECPLDTTRLDNEGILKEIPECITKLKNLEQVFIMPSKIMKLDHLSELKNLKDLNISKVSMFDPKEFMKLEGLDKLESLSINNMGMQFIKNVKGEERTSFSMPLITKITEFPKLPSLKKLHLTNDGITEFDNVELKNLKKLDLSNNSLKKIGNSVKMDDLESLIMYNNGDIDEFNIFHGSISELSSIYPLKKLKELSLDRSGIDTINMYSLLMNITCNLTDLEKIWMSTTRNLEPHVSVFFMNNEEVRSRPDHSITFVYLSGWRDEIKSSDAGGVDGIRTRKVDIGEELW